ncbi:FUSC family protein [Nonomuraea sp. bgisy101]|uniref:FUSC family protein n=1 Tax=Nonomuraea sp. bgisy101 TaxID=3413784 RepID=UPI003D756BDE
MLVIMVAVLLGYGTALLIGLDLGAIIQTVALTWTLAWTQRTADLSDHLIGLVVLPVTALALAGTGSFMPAVFVLAAGVAIWIRRFGPRATKAGTLATLPLITALVVPEPIASGPWTAVATLIAVFWVAVAQVPGGLLGRTPAAAAERRAGSGILPSTRMALQMSVALSVAFAAGHLAFPEHWTWAVLTTFIVCSGSRSRGDVLHKGALRALGAALGTVVASWIAGLFGPRDPWAVVLIFAILAAATWLRPKSYGYWAACITAALSLLYGYIGQADPALLRQRLMAIVAGAVIGIAASWLIAPIRTVDVVRRRVADALAALADLLRGEDREYHRARFDHAVEQLGLLAGPLKAHRALRRRGGPHLADAIDAVRSCAGPARAVNRSSREPETVAAVLANITAVRLAIGRRPGPAYRPPSSPGADEALAEIDAALSRLAALFPHSPAS